MSSGKIERNYLDNFEKNLISDESAILTDYSLEVCKLSEHKLHKEGIKQENKNRVAQPGKGLKEYHFLRIKMIHSILMNSEELTQKQKFAYCNSQRFYMKQYLKRISKNI